MWLAYLPHWEETEDPGLKLAVFCTAPAIRNTPANLLSRDHRHVRCCVFGVLALGADDGHRGHAASCPLLVGLLVVVIGLSLGGPTGYAINPARDLGPRIMHAILPIAGKGPLGLGLLVGAGRRPAHRRHARRGAVRRVLPGLIHGDEEAHQRP